MIGPILHQEMLLGGRRYRLHVLRWIYAGWLVLQRSRVGAVQHQRQRAPTEEVAVDLHFRQGVAKLADCGARGVVDEHLLRSRLR